MSTIKDFQKKAEEVEQHFGQLMENLGHVVIKATTEEDIHEHWDLSYDNIKVDVKMTKRVHRYDPLPDENFHYLEYQNVKGDPGWLYGQADKIAFEIEEYFILIAKLDLTHFFNKKNTNPNISETPLLYRLYRRRNDGDQDIVMLVKTIDLLMLPHQLIRK